MLRDSVPFSTLYILFFLFFSPNVRDIAFNIAELNASLRLVTSYHLFHNANRIHNRRRHRLQSHAVFIRQDDVNNRYFLIRVSVPVVGEAPGEMTRVQRVR